MKPPFCTLVAAFFFSVVSAPAAAQICPDAPNYDSYETQRCIYDAIPGTYRMTGRLVENNCGVGRTVRIGHTTTIKPLVGSAVALSEYDGTAIPNEEPYDNYLLTSKNLFVSGVRYSVRGYYDNEDDYFQALFTNHKKVIAKNGNVYTYDYDWAFELDTENSTPARRRIFATWDISVRRGGVRVCSYRYALRGVSRG